MTTPTMAGSQTASGKLAQAFITEARYKLNEPEAAFWTDAELLEWLNEAIVLIAAQTMCLGTSEAITLVADTFEYALTDSAYASIVAVVYNGTLGLYRSDPRSLGRVDADLTTPKYFYEWDGKVGIFPVPAATVGNTCTVYLADIPSRVGVTDAIPLPMFYDHALVNYMVAMAWWKDSKWTRGNTYLSLFSAIVDRFRKDFSERARDAAAEAGDAP